MSLLCNRLNRESCIDAVMEYNQTWRGHAAGLTETILNEQAHPNITDGNVRSLAKTSSSESENAYSTSVTIQTSASTLTFEIADGDGESCSATDTFFKQITFLLVG
jgi:hypothetical protein